MPSKMRRYGTAGRPGVPGGFSGPSKGAIRLHNSSGVCHSVGNEVSGAITFLLQRDEQGKYMLPRPRFQVFGQTLSGRHAGRWGADPHDAGTTSAELGRGATAYAGAGLRGVQVRRRTGPGTHGEEGGYHPVLAA